MRILFLLLIASPVVGQQLAELSVEEIMRDPKWIGTSPSDIFWSEDSKTIYFDWNPDRTQGDSLYAASVTDLNPRKVTPSTRRALPAARGVYNRTKTKKLYEKSGDLFLLDIPSGKIRQITNTLQREFNPSFALDETRIFYTSEMNLFSWNISDGSLLQLTDFKRGGKKAESKTTEQEDWLKQDQLAYFQILKERKEKSKSTEKMRESNNPSRPKSIFLDNKNVDNIIISADENFITFRLTRMASKMKNTIVPNYVTESGFTEDITARTKVGAEGNQYEFCVYDIPNDTVHSISIEKIAGIFDKPEYTSDYPEKTDGNKKDKPAPRAVMFHGPFWSEDGQNNFMVLRAMDNKDRWIVSLNPSAQELKLLDRQHDEAWVGGPGIGSYYGPGNVGWLDNQHVWFHSEETGYSHLYSVNVLSGKKEAITSGRYEVQDSQLSNDKKFFFITTNEIHPGEKHFYKVPVKGGKGQRLTSMTGANEVTLSPDEKWLAIRSSSSTKPWELFLAENKQGVQPQQITNSLTSEFKSYPWREPKLITFKARDRAEVYARLYQPKTPEAKGPAVIFVHGAGYLQNAHKWWSSYFREFMFHNLLADQGYTVIDIDYRGSAGYGRDWRTGIYRFMGGKDLTDQVDAANHLIDRYSVDPKRIGIYGGSYGGFITLMALFTTPDVFAAGAALRPVTDWAHYNHPYTSNILNVPYADSIAYIKSSPLYHAEGLKGALLICHGMVDTNVHFQDAVRLSQRLIELGKENWELAVYPIENHGFVEPSSWTDEYKRILKLFEENLKMQGTMTENH
jgi:dipeptidyl aminopeptidase/acylaminoacyl peptidase